MVKHPHEMSTTTVTSTPVNLIRKSPDTHHPGLPIHPSLAVEALVGLDRLQLATRPPQQPPPPILTTNDFLPKVPSLSVSRCQGTSNRAQLEPPTVHNLTTLHPEPPAIHSLVHTTSKPQGFEIIPTRPHQQLPAGHVIRLPQQPHPQVSWLISKHSRKLPLRGISARSGSHGIKLPRDRN